MITSLFCDLVGFTAASEAADPEDVDLVLAEYFAVARQAIERHGGIVEKFIGDAVYGVFGVPVGHEDDPARAVRAGLDICAEAARLRGTSGAPLRLRVGVNTGETFVRLGVRSDTGEHFVTGDAVNTAARIQSAAPEQGVAVGSGTWEATRFAFEYQALPPATVKGKSEPLRLYQAIAERTAAGIDLSRAHAGPYVGRRVELDRLRDVFEEAVAGRVTRLAIVTGEPGIGKTRLITEFAEIARTISPSLTWRQGRCLSYGDGLGFWALGEIVKTHAGILEADDSIAASARISVTLEGLPDGEWIQDRVLPLVGLAAGRDATREELFSAWARYVQAMAGSAAAVIVFEDVHWADPNLLSFIESLAGLSGAALLIVVTARPEAWLKTPGFAHGLDRVVRVTLEPLDPTETEAFVSGLLGSVVPADLHATILGLSEGNPLYVEELMRLLEDRQLLEHADGGIRLRAGATIPLPASIHSLLASRLDMLAERERATILAAAVIGTVFWPGAAAAVGKLDDAHIQPTLQSLGERELVRRRPDSTISGEDEYAFWHALARDVAYAALARRDRLDGHLAAAAWIRAKAGRQQDLAAVVAHHLLTSLELATASDPARAEAIRPEARVALTAAAEQAMRIDPGVAAELLDRALELAPPGDPERPPLLRAYGVAATRSADNVRAIAAMEEALEHHRAGGDEEAAASTMLAMVPALWAVQDRRLVEFPREAVRILEARGPSAELVEAYQVRAGAGLWDWSWDEVKTFARRSIDMAARLGLPTPLRALSLLGQSRLASSDIGGFDDCERAVQEATATGDWSAAASVLTNYSEYASVLLGYSKGIELIRRGIEISDAHGLSSVGLLHRTSLASALVETGRLDEGVLLINEIVEPVAASGDVIGEGWLLALRSEVARIRGDLRVAAEPVPRLLEIFLANPEQDDLNFPRLQVAAVLAASGAPAESLRVLRTILDGPVRRENYELLLPAMTRLALALDEQDIAAGIAAGVEPRYPVVELGLATAAALVAEARGDHARAAAGYLSAAPRWLAHEIPFEAAAAFLGAGRSLMAADGRVEASEALASARELFTDLGAAPSLADLSALAAEGTTA